MREDEKREKCPGCGVHELAEHRPGCDFDADGCMACLYEFLTLPWLCPHSDDARKGQMRMRFTG